MNGRPETEQLLRAMLATALRRGQLFVTGGNSNLLPVEPPVTCRHDAHSEVEAYSADDTLFLSERIEKGDLFYAGGLNMLVPLRKGPNGSWLCYSVTLCRPEWRFPTDLRMGDWVFRSPPHWDVIDTDFLKSLLD
jgi:hypothetical protein